MFIEIFLVKILKFEVEGSKAIVVKLGFLRVLYFGKPGEAYNIGNNIPEVSVKNIYYILQKIQL